MNNSNQQLREQLNILIKFNKLFSGKLNKSSCPYWAEPPAAAAACAAA